MTLYDQNFFDSSDKDKNLQVNQGMSTLLPVERRINVMGEALLFQELSSGADFQVYYCKMHWPQNTI